MKAREANRCPYCLADLDLGGSEVVVRCERCATPHHGACFAEHGRCTLLGCGGRAGAEEDPPAGPALAGLHPFLPLGERLIRRTASFLSVRGAERDRRKRHSQKRWLRIDLPSVAILGEDLEGRLGAFAPKRVTGQGLRLVVCSVLDTGRQSFELSRQEAVIVGRASEGWLSRLKLWSRDAEPETLLSPGVSSFGISFDPTPLSWWGSLPEEAADGGPRLSLEVFAELDAPGKLLSEVRRVRLLDGRSRPPALEGAEPLDLSTASSPLPLRRRRSGTSWEPRPLTVGDPLAEAVEPCAELAVRCEKGRGDPVEVDGLDLTLEGLEGRVLHGHVDLALRKGLSGRLLLEVISQRRGWVRGRRLWRRYVQEHGVLCAGSAEGEDVSGRHRLRFQYVLPVAYSWGKDRDLRRLRVRAHLLGEGAPLRSRRRTLGSGRRPVRRRR